MALTFDFTNKVVLVTGASSGLGQTTAILFAKAGASVVLGGRDQKRLDESRDQCIKASGGYASRFVTVGGDVRSHLVRQNLVNNAVESFGRLDILVANAGVGVPKGGIDDATEESFDEIFNTNVKSIFFLIQYSLPHLVNSKGNVIIVSSMSSTEPLGGAVLYPMTKAVVDHMTRCVSLDLAAMGVRVNSVNPSYVPTRFLRAFGDTDDINKMAVALDSCNHPLHSKCITSEDVANNIAFLASGTAKSITGQNHVIDGGRHFMGPIQGLKE